MTAFREALALESEADHFYEVALLAAANKKYETAGRALARHVKLLAKARRTMRRATEPLQTRLLVAASPSLNHV